MRKFIAAALLAGLITYPVAVASAAAPHGGGGSGGPAASMLGLTRLSPQAGTKTGGGALMFYNPGVSKITILIKVTGLAPFSVHPAHIHRGACGSNGPVLFPLPDLQANANGVALAATTLAAQSIPDHGWYLNVHAGPDLAGAHFTPIACGNVRRASAAAAIGGQNNAHAGGLAFMATNAASSDLVLVVTRLAPNTVHPAHIHLGVCGSNGPVTIALPNVVADASGIGFIAVSIPTTTIPAHGWYVNLHRGPGLAGPQFTPIACGNVVHTTAA